MILGSAFRFNCKTVKSWLKFLCVSERCVKCRLHCWIISMEPVSFSGESPAICPCGSSGLIRVYLLLEAYCLSCCMLGTNGEKALESLLFRLQIFHLILVLMITRIFCCQLCLLSSSSYSFILKNYLFLIDWWLLFNIGLISVKCRRPWFNACVRKIPWRREWQPTPVFLPGEFHGQKSLVGYSPWGCKELGMTEQQTLTYTKRGESVESFVPAMTRVAHLLGSPPFMSAFPTSYQSFLGPRPQ